MNFLGYITASPKGRRKVPEEFRRVYGRCVGTGTCLLYTSPSPRDGLRWIAYSEQMELIILTVGVIAGVALILYGQLRYNRRF